MVRITKAAAKQATRLLGPKRSRKCPRCGADPYTRCTSMHSNNLKAGNTQYVRYLAHDHKER
jgi:hypothetical protein